MHTVIQSYSRKNCCFVLIVGILRWTQLLYILRRPEEEDEDVACARRDGHGPVVLLPAVYDGFAAPVETHDVRGLDGLHLPAAGHFSPPPLRFRLLSEVRG